jgi:large subunit ribosomal protein L15|tara:strand:+ start:5518 stop:6003 length:486 start_codon:yes stop_codon:yes gene_type:complete
VKVHDLKPAPGSKTRGKRVARGIGGKGGKTAGRGSKGQRARNTVRVGFEGGQMPLHMRIPKLRGFKNPFRVEYQAVNLDAIEESGLNEVSPETLLSLGLVRKNALIKILGRGEINRAVSVKAHAWSKSAEEAVTAAGGSLEKLPLPFAVRPPSSGNAHMNR